LDASVSDDDLRDVALFAARAQPQAADALRLLDEAEAAFGASAVLDHERTARGDARNRNLAARSAWEHVALGRAHLAAGDPRGASRELSAALGLEPAARWANFYAGVCAYRMNRFEEARAAFSLCIGAAPGDAKAFYNRALASAALGRPSEALSDCERALTLSPNHAQARGLREQLLNLAKR
jgi:tetratricopeptide (TPR) repeat protein